MEVDLDTEVTQKIPPQEPWRTGQVKIEEGHIVDRHCKILDFHPADLY
jgi:hypothetical protein